jgi:SNF2 family DNA or RNA helicase
MISLIEERFKKEKIKSVRISGKVSAKDREVNKTLFQDRNSGTNIIMITTAGSESINLQTAEHIILVDSPWSWGDYVQLIGRAVRIGSKNVSVLVTHLIAKRIDGTKTIDDHKISVLKDKKRVADKSAGESIKDGLVMSSSDIIKDVFNLISDYRKSDVNSKEELRKTAIKLKSTSKKNKKEKIEKMEAKEFPMHKIMEIDI